MDCSPFPENALACASAPMAIWRKSIAFYSDKACHACFKGSMWIAHTCKIIPRSKILHFQNSVQIPYGFCISHTLSQILQRVTMDFLMVWCRFLKESVWISRKNA